MSCWKQDKISAWNSGLVFGPGYRYMKPWIEVRPWPGPPPYNRLYVDYKKVPKKAGNQIRIGLLGSLLRIALWPSSVNQSAWYRVVLDLEKCLILPVLKGKVLDKVKCSIEISAESCSALNHVATMSRLYLILWPLKLAINAGLSSLFEKLSRCRW